MMGRGSGAWGLELQSRVHENDLDRVAVEDEFDVPERAIAFVEEMRRRG